jgi:hypothetical protein
MFVSVRVFAVACAWTFVSLSSIGAFPFVPDAQGKPIDFGTSRASVSSLSGSTAARLSTSAAIVNVPVCTAPYDQNGPALTSLGGGGPIAAWSDYRGGSLDIYVQKLNWGGGSQWPADGLPACKAAGNQINPQVVADGAGGVIVVWQDSRSGAADIYAQRLNTQGGAVWAANGVVVSSAANAQRNPVVVGDGVGGAIVAWVDERGVDADVYVQRLNGGGVAQWTANGVALCTAAGVQEGVSAISDAQGGALVVWRDDRGGASESDIYARRVDGAGAPQWAANGVAVSAATGVQETPAAVTDGVGGAIVTWGDSRGASRDVYVQRLNGGGVAQWTANGVLLCGAAGSQQGPQLCSDGANGALVVWEDRRGAAADIYARRVNGAGAPQWAVDGVGVCTATADQLTPAIALDPVGGAVVTWSDARTPANGQDIYLQHLQLDGSSLWTANGVLVCDTTGNQTTPGVAVDGLGGAIAVWRDFRSGVDWDLYSQRVNATGQVPSQCTSTVALVPSSVLTVTSPVNFYSWTQDMLYWSAVGVRPSTGTDWDIEAYEPFSFGLNAYPTCFGLPFAGSFASSGVDFVICNFNIGRTPILQDYGVRVSRFSGASTAQVEWDGLDNIIDKDCTGGNCGAQSGNGWVEVLDVWDVFLFAGQTYTFDFTKTGSADIKLLLFYAPGTSGPFFAPRSARVLETTSRYSTYQAPTTAWYGVVMVNDNGLSGTYTTKVWTGALPTGVGDRPAVTGIRGVAPNPSRGEAMIQFGLTANAEVSFQVLDMAGRRVGLIPPERWNSGTWTARWNGSGTDGRPVAPGVYFVQMRVDGKPVGQTRLALIR